MSSTIITGLKTYTVQDDEIEILQSPHVIGVILFERNYVHPTQLHNLITNIHTLRNAANQPRLMICVDQEGGDVQRLQQAFTTLPAAKQFGTLYNTHPEKALHIARQSGWVTAIELLTYGIDFNIGPVLDLDRGNVRLAEQQRCLHSEPAAVTAIAQAYIDGMNHAGMAVIGKHFPGHGVVNADSHFELPIHSGDLNTLCDTELLPYKNLIKNNSLTAIMPAHIQYTNIENLPASFSPYWLNTVLRQQLNFQGAIISDDLSMLGAQKWIPDFIERHRTTLSAGCDIILVCFGHLNQYSELKQLLEDLTEHPPFSTETQLTQQQRIESLYANHDPITLRSTLQSTEFIEAKAEITELAKDHIKAKPISLHIE